MFPCDHVVHGPDICVMPKLSNEQPDIAGVLYSVDVALVAPHIALALSRGNLNRHARTEPVGQLSPLVYDHHKSSYHLFMQRKLATYMYQNVPISPFGSWHIGCEPHAILVNYFMFYDHTVHQSRPQVLVHAMAVWSTSPRAQPIAEASWVIARRHRPLIRQFARAP